MKPAPDLIIAQVLINLSFDGGEKYLVCLSHRQHL